ncbi:peptidase S8/S53 domain-containing protein [Lactarius quietus]|nr:peptidase S8/S53 domain-containing protein [Lactarius quietus]
MWNTLPDGWESVGPPPAGITIDLYIALRPHSENALIDALHEVSNPRHQKYGAHLSKEEVAELVAPHQDTLEIVHSWLEHHGVPSSDISTSHGGGWLTVTGVAVSQADQLLCASYHLYKHTGTNETILRTVGYALPESLHPLVETVAPTTYFASPRTLMLAPRMHSSEESAVMVKPPTSGRRVRVLSKRDTPPITPPVVRKLYQTEQYVPAAGGQNALGTLGMKKEYPSQADLTKFMTDYRSDAVTATFYVIPVNGGGYDPTSPGIEASLDIQYASAMAYPTLQIFYSTGGSVKWLNGVPTAEDAYLAWLKYLLMQTHIPPTITVSYGNPETSVPWTYATALCNVFAQLGLRGVSVLVASGDDGVGRGDCRDGAGNVRFYTYFPASCTSSDFLCDTQKYLTATVFLGPWVTAVGGTMDIPEVALPQSGGGFSQYFGRPNYQNGAVLPFLQNLGNQYAGLYNAVGRAVPDIASLAEGVRFFIGEELYTVAGTSCSTPTVSGIISLLNDYLISTDRQPLGFLNIWLYDRGIAGLNDITSGTNPGCNTEGSVQ